MAHQQDLDCFLVRNRSTRHSPLRLAVQTPAATIPLFPLSELRLPLCPPSRAVCPRPDTTAISYGTMPSHSRKRIACMIGTKLWPPDSGTFPSATHHFTRPLSSLLDLCQHSFGLESRVLCKRCRVLHQAQRRTHVHTVFAACSCPCFLADLFAMFNPASF